MRPLQLPLDLVEARECLRRLIRRNGDPKDEFFQTLTEVQVTALRIVVENYAGRRADIGSPEDEEE